MSSRFIIEETFNPVTPVILPCLSNVRIHPFIDTSREDEFLRIGEALMPTRAGGSVNDPDFAVLYPGYAC